MNVDDGEAAPFGEAYAITVLFDVGDEVFDEFHRLICDNAARSVLAEAGCRRFDVLSPRGPDGKRQVLLYEIYTDRAAFDAHLATDHFREFDARTRGMVRSKTLTEFGLREHAKTAISR